jgi:hypothetical protein
MGCLRGDSTLETGRADKYRQHAADCLEAAQAATDYRTRRALLSIAQSWQRLAQQIELRSNPVGASHLHDEETGPR